MPIAPSAGPFSCVLLSLGDGHRVLAPPANHYRPSLLLVGLLRGLLEVLADDLDLSSICQFDQVSGQHPRVGDVEHGSALGVEPVALSPLVEQPYLLGADREGRALAFEQVRG